MASSKIIELDDTNTCKLCDNAVAKYICPKCNVLYCSLSCYQSDNHRTCSEQFYKDNIFEELELNESDPSSKTRMLEILKKVHESNPLIDDTFEDEESEALDSDDQEFVDIADRLANVDLDDAEKVWEKLTEDEKKEFVAFLQSEDVTKLIPSWNPWWSFYDDSKVQELNQEKSYKYNCPSIEGIHKFSGICKKEPVQSVKYNLVNILAGYAFTTRYFNGEYLDFPKEAASCIGAVALSLKCHQNFEDFETAVKSVEQECINSDWIVTDAENISNMKKDLENILKGPIRMDEKYYVLCALSDLHNLFKMALNKKEVKSGNSFAKNFPNEHFPEVKMHEPDKIKMYMKRVEYFLSYSQNFPIM
ncbi:hypothetical protein HHI36_021570 [Cryptolaemus montrouzieri]|uniref:HIT-type domain-containing protein n=1 Tax=Cryptolaemus montrouzieri TaxID=559131 RepID=A0ABD2MXB7_9CUCU